LITDKPAYFEYAGYLGEIKKKMERSGITADILSVSPSEYQKSDLEFPVRQTINTGFSIRKMGKYDLLHVQFSFPLGLVYALLKRVHHRSVLIHTHGYDVFSVPSIGYGLRRNGLGRALTGCAWESSSGVIATCMKSREEILKANISPRKLDVLYNGVDTELFRKKKEIGDHRLIKIRENSDLIFLNVGSLTPVKNHASLITTFSHFSKSWKEGKKSRLIICGQGPLKRKLLNLARKLKVAANVIFLGQQPRGLMPEVYSIADAFILPSFSEAHPWSLLEAMSCELPSVASSVGGIPETIQDERLLFRPESVKGYYLFRLLEKMVFLAQDEKERKEIGTRNRRIVTEKFAIERHIRELGMVYRRTHSRS
jgi:glycosyltransferase involved in cell wall biosynthesis